MVQHQAQTVKVEMPAVVQQTVQGSGPSQGQQTGGPRPRLDVPGRALPRDSSVDRMSSDELRQWLETLGMDLRIRKSRLRGALRDAIAVLRAEPSS